MNKKIYIPKFMGRLFPEDEKRSKVLRSGNVQPVKKRLDENGKPVKDDKGRFIWDKTGDKQYIKVIEFTNKENVKKLELCLSLGIVYDNSGDKQSGQSPDMSGAITMNFDERKFAAWYVEDEEFSGQDMRVTISQVIGNEVSLDEVPLEDIQDAEDDQIPF